MCTQDSKCKPQKFCFIMYFYPTALYDPGYNIQYHKECWNLKLFKMYLDYPSEKNTRLTIKEPKSDE